MATSISKSNHSIITTDIPKILNQFIKEEKAVFVFPSSIARDSWCEWTILNHKTTGIKCTPLEKWMAWDEFKSAFCTREIAGLTCITGPLRKLFARHILSKKMNKDKPYFEVIVNKADCKSLLHFNSWLSNLLPNLKQWAVKKFGNIDIEKDYEKIYASISDAEDRDFFKVYCDYIKFLKSNSLYDPEYLESDFNDTEHTFIIFFPETLNDFFTYENLFEKENVYTVSTPIVENQDAHPKCILYPDARSELRKTILQIRELNNNGIAWDDIALTVPDIETSSNYIERELKLYEVPYTLRTGYDKTINCPGQIFPEIEQCVKNNFAFPYLRALMEDSYIPWRYHKSYERIIEIANETRSLFPYNKSNSEETEDPVESALEKLNTQNLLENYKTFKKLISDFYNAKSFSALREGWKEINTNLLRGDNTKAWETDGNNIIGLCINNLDELKNLESRFINKSKNPLYIDSCYDFFLERLKEDPYVPKNDKNRAISIFDYKMAGPAYYKYQFIINANQKNLSVNTKELDFLKEDKRSLLGCRENNKVSEAYINLYNKDYTKATFSCSSNGFSGFSISHTYFNEIESKDLPELDALDEKDFYINENKWLLQNGRSPSEITEHQKNAMTQWISRIQGDEDNSETKEKIAQAAKEKLRYIEKELDPEGKYYKISQTDLKNFFPCPRKWVFTKVFQIEEEKISQDIFDHFDAGNIFHETLNHWLKDYYLGKNLPVFGSSSWDENTIKGEISASITKVLTPPKDKKLKISDFKQSPLRLQIIESQKDKMIDQIYDFLSYFCTSPDISPKGRFGTYKVISTEQSYLSEDAEEKDFYRVYGKIDALLSNPDESKGEAIIDFKTGTAPTAKESQIAQKKIAVNGTTVSDFVMQDFQMATYTYLLDSAKNSKHNVQEGLFYTNKAESSNPWNYVINYIYSNVYSKYPPRDNSEKGFNKTLPEFQKYLDTFKNLLENKELEPDFSGTKLKTYTDKNSTCKNCRFKSICRTTYTMAKFEEKGGNQ